LKKSTFVLALVAASSWILEDRAVASDDPRGERLAAAAARILARKELSGAVVGVDVRSLSTGERVWSRNAERALAPASNLKVVTLYLALSTLGPQYEFETPLVAGGPVIEGGLLAGDLWIRGSGDPSLRPCFFESEQEAAPLEPFVQALQLQGVTRIRGDLVVDARAFDELFVPEGWPKDQLDQDYAAPVAALSLNGNCATVRVTGRKGASPQAELRPDVAGWRLQNDLSLDDKASACKVSVAPPDSDGVIRVRGSVGGDVAATPIQVPVPDPPLFFGNALRAAIERAGITIGGVVRRCAPDEQPREHGRTLYTRRSPLLPALLLCGKESDNNIAEHLLKKCALARSGKGSVEEGARLVQELASELGVEGGAPRIVDGSGLSRLDLVSPAFLAALLSKAWQAPWRDDFVRCLPISGVDGTLDKRMNEPALQSRVRAKTGFIAQVSALSGYALAGDDGEVFAFSILVNGFKGSNAEIKKAQDDLCRAIVALPRSAE
jgi:D-alanyl-D-alanine carboxypeptidase/D-alanyl-D-alanine-endopeptidase (penicillin-binding protein 4)